MYKEIHYKMERRPRALREKQQRDSGEIMAVATTRPGTIHHVTPARAVVQDVSESDCLASTTSERHPSEAPSRHQGPINSGNSGHSKHHHQQFAQNDE